MKNSPVDMELWNGVANENPFFLSLSLSPRGSIAYNNIVRNTAHAIRVGIILSFLSFSTPGNFAQPLFAKMAAKLLSFFHFFPSHFYSQQSILFSRKLDFHTVSSVPRGYARIKELHALQLYVYVNCGMKELPSSLSSEYIIQIHTRAFEVFPSPSFRFHELPRLFPISFSSLPFPTLHDAQAEL